MALVAALGAPACIQVAGLEDVEPLPDAGSPDADEPAGPREVGYLKPQVPGTQDRFGTAVAVAGDFAVIGAPFEDSSATGVGGAHDDDAPSAGAAFVLDLAAGADADAEYLKPHYTTGSMRFGAAVAASGDTLVIGAPGDASSLGGINVDPSDGGADDSGAVHVFVRDGDTWVHQAYIKASNAGANDEFGEAVAIDGDTLVVGATGEDGQDGEDDDLATDAGAAYVFVRAAGVWRQQAYLKAPVPGRGDKLGRSVAIDGDRIVVGAPSTQPGGVAHVFARDSEEWSHLQLLQPPSVTEGGAFGVAVAVEDGLVVVSDVAAEATRDGELIEQAGQVHAFATDGGHLGPLSHDPQRIGHFGTALTLAGGRLAVSSSLYYQDVWLFERGDDWQLVAHLRSRYTEDGDGFGRSVGMAGERLVVGAPTEGSGRGDQPTDNTVEGAGAAYVFEL